MLTSNFWNLIVIAVHNMGIGSVCRHVFYSGCIKFRRYPAKLDDEKEAFDDYRSNAPEVYVR